MRNQLIVIPFFPHIRLFVTCLCLLTDSIDASCWLNGSFPATPKQPVCLHQRFVRIHSARTCRLSLGRSSLSSSAAAIQDVCFSRLSPAAFVTLAKENRFLLPQLLGFFVVVPHPCFPSILSHCAKNGRGEKAHTLHLSTILSLYYIYLLSTFLA